MRALFPNCPEAIDNTQKIVDLCNVDFQAVPDGVHVGDPQAVGHHGPGPRPAARPHRDAVLLGVADEVGHDEEVIHKAHLPDHAHLIGQAGRVLNFPYAEVDNIAKQVPFDIKMTLDKALVLSSGLRDLYNGDERVKELVDMARKIEGMPRNASTHAAGVVITKRPVYEYVPLATRAGCL